MYEVTPMAIANAVPNPNTFGRLLAVPKKCQQCIDYQMVSQERNVMRERIGVPINPWMQPAANPPTVGFFQSCFSRTFAVAADTRKSEPVVAPAKVSKLFKARRTVKTHRDHR